LLRRCSSHFPRRTPTSESRRAAVHESPTAVCCVSFLSSPLSFHQHNLSTAAHTHTPPAPNTTTRESTHAHAPRTHIMLGAPIFIKSKEEALPDVKNWYAGTSSLPTFHSPSSTPPHRPVVVVSPCWALACRSVVVVGLSSSLWWWPSVLMAHRSTQPNAI
jgi:hypothetical protein